MKIRLFSVAVFAGLLAGGRVTAAPTPPVLPALNVPSSGLRLPGKFVWGDLLTDNAAVTRKFYSGLFGWNFRAVAPGTNAYTVAFNDDRPLCGIVQVQRREGQLGHPRWVGYV